MRQTNLEAAASLLAAADASVVAGVLPALQRPFAPVHGHGAATGSVKRGRGCMGTHGCRRKVQRAGAEVCRQGKGALACLLRWPMSGCDGRLGRHQHGGVGLDGQCVYCMFTPARGSRRGSVSAVGFRFAQGMHRRRSKGLRGMIGGERALREGTCHADRPTQSPALAAAGAGCWQRARRGAFRASLPPWVMDI